MGKKTEEKIAQPAELDALKSINEKLAELVDLARANAVNVNRIASTLAPKLTAVPGLGTLTQTTLCGRVLTADNEACVLPKGHKGGCTIYGPNRT